MLRWPAVVFCGWLCLACSLTRGAELNWSGLAPANSNWSDNSNWLPSDSAAGNDLVIGDFVVDDTFVDADISIDSLSLTNGATADTSASELTIGGLTAISGSGSTLIVSSHQASSTQAAVLANDMNAQSGGQILLNNGVLQLDDVSPQTAMVNIGSGGSLAGSGTLRLNETLAGSPTVTLINDGVIKTLAAADHLTITSTDADHRLDLDGTNGSGQLELAAGSTLELDVATESFAGQFDVYDSATLTFSHPLQVVGGSLNLINAASLGSPTRVQSTATLMIAGGMLQASGLVNQIDAPAHFNGSTGGGIDVATGSTLQFMQDVQMDGLSTATGSGELQFHGSQVTVSGFQLIDLSGGTGGDGRRCDASRTVATGSSVDHQC